MNKKNGQPIYLTVLVVGILTAARAMAGSLDPTNVPGPTMHTLEEIYQKINMCVPLQMQTLTATTTVVQAGYYVATNLTQVDVDLAARNIKTNVTIFGIAGTLSTNASASDGYPSPVAKTGQTPTLPLNPAPAGSDGALQKGVAWPNPRFTDNGNGTVTDNLTGLVWLKNANAFGERTWANALADCNTLNSGEYGLTDGSVEGNWRLPNIEELHSLIAWQYYNPALSNTAGTSQWSSGNPFTGVQSASYWSSSTFAPPPIGAAWYVSLQDGGISGYYKMDTYYVWPVRDGP